MEELDLKELIQIFLEKRIQILLITAIFIVIGIICAYNAFGNTWTIQDGHFKEVYDNKEECLKSNLGTRTTDKCYDDKQVIYKNK